VEGIEMNRDEIIKACKDQTLICVKVENDDGSIIHIDVDKKSLLQQLELDPPIREIEGTFSPYRFALWLGDDE
jgi:hypothetical protein